MDRFSTESESLSPHALRHCYISGMLDAETPNPILAERCDVSEAVIDKHYHERSEAEKQDLRRRILDEITRSSNPGYAH